MDNIQKFGGHWTVEKLDILTGYLDAYLVALKKHRFKNIDVTREGCELNFLGKNYARTLDLTSRRASFEEKASADLTAEAVDMIMGFLETK